MPFTDMKSTAGFALCWSFVAFVWMLSLVVMFGVNWFKQKRENLRCSGFPLEVFFAGH